jgi:uncharacterized repeat protein (TIGR03803 family)
MSRTALICSSLFISLLIDCVTMIGASAQTFTKLADFEGTNGANSWAALVQGPDGNLYGTAGDGGAFNYGAVSEITLSGALTAAHSFNIFDGAFPEAPLLLSVDGRLYGTTSGGGKNTDCGANGGCGAVVRIMPNRKVTTLYAFCATRFCADGYAPVGALMQAANGIFYGTTSGGGIKGNYGTVFKVSPAGSLTTLYSFGGTDGQAPSASLIQATDGDFYGTTFYGGNGVGCGTSGCGTVFKITPKGKLTTLHSFVGSDGKFPTASLIQAKDGNFYGTTLEGGANGYGSVFKFTPPSTFITLYSFCAVASCFDGGFPSAALIQATDGNFYGTTSIQAYGFGTVFEMTPSGNLTTLYTFCSLPACADGASPYGALLQVTNGNFYGTTYAGGIDNEGTVFSLYTGLASFVTFVRNSGKIGQTGGILGQGFTGTTSVELNGSPVSFTVVSDTFIKATVPSGATTGYVEVATPSATLQSNVPFRVIP